MGELKSPIMEIVENHLREINNLVEAAIIHHSGVHSGVAVEGVAKNTTRITRGMIFMESSLEALRCNDCGVYLKIIRNPLPAPRIGFSVDISGDYIDYLKNEISING